MGTRAVFILLSCNDKSVSKSDIDSAALSAVSHFLKSSPNTFHLTHTAL